MKKITQIKPIILLSVAFALLSCTSLTQVSYNDDIYYSKKDEAKQSHTYQAAKPKADTELSAEYLGEKSYYNEDYDDYEYSERLEKFDDEYEGEYYNEDERNWSLSFGMGYGSYGSSWGMGFNYGYPYYNYYDPYFYNPWYDPFYSWYSPWYSPWYMPYYSYYPYYGCYHSCYYPGYPSNPIYHGDNGIAYGHRKGKSTGGRSDGSSTKGIAVGGGMRDSQFIRESKNISSSPAATANNRDVQNDSKQRESTTRNEYSVPAAQDRPTKNQTVTNIRTQTQSQDARAANTTRTVPDGTSLKSPVNYSRTNSTAARNNQTRTGYTPSYTRPKSSSPKYNTSTRTSSNSRSPQRYSTTSTSNNRTNYTGSTRSSSTRSSTAAKPRSSSPTRTTATSPQRTNSRSSSYSTPKSSSSRSSSYSPSRSSSSSPSRSSGATRSSGSSSRSSSGGHRR